MKKLLILTAVLIAVAVSGTMIAADTATVAVTANVVGTCKFSSGGTLAFGGLDPSVASNVNANASPQPVFWCTKGSSYTISDNKGLNGGGTTFQMKHASLADLIPYTFTYTTTGAGTGPGTPITMNIAGTVLGTDYANKSAGNYADTVTLSITP